VGEQHVLAFPWIPVEVVELRHAVLLDLSEDRIDLLEVHLPVAPLDPVNIVAMLISATIAANDFSLDIE
jgi:hypothetical protein